MYINHMTKVNDEVKSTKDFSSQLSNNYKSFFNGIGNHRNASI